MRPLELQHATRIVLGIVVACTAGCSSRDAAHGDADAPPVVVASERLDAALRLFDSGRYEASKAILDGLLKDPQENLRRDLTLLLAAQCCEHLGDLDQAVATYASLIDTERTSRATIVVPVRLYAIALAILERPPQTWLDELVPDTKSATLALSRIAIDFPGSDYADDAWMQLAKIHLAEGEGERAVHAYERLCVEHPNSEFVEEARFKTILAQEARSRGKGYDPQPLLAARDAAIRYLKQYGADGRFAKEAAQKIRDLTHALADHELAIAKYYAAIGNAAGATLHTNNAAKLLGDEPLGTDSTDLFTKAPKRAAWDSRR